MLDFLKNKLIEKAERIGTVLDNTRATPEVQQARMDICKSCDKLHSTEFCKVCSCYMPVKTWLVNASCPIKKWDKEST